MPFSGDSQNCVKDFSFSVASGASGALGLSKNPKRELPKCRKYRTMSWYGAVPAGVKDTDACEIKMSVSIVAQACFHNRRRDRE